MGLFSKNKGGSVIPLLYPAGIESEREQEFASDAPRIFVITPEERSRMGLPSVDLDSYLDATYAHNLGLSEAETILAWGPVHIGPHQIIDREFDGTAVVTEESLMVWWLPKKSGLIHVMHSRHDRIQHLEVRGATAAHISWQDAIYADDTGKYKVEDPRFYIAARVTKDGHANRRAFYLYYTFAHYVNQIMNPLTVPAIMSSLETRIKALPKTFPSGEILQSDSLELYCQTILRTLFSQAPRPLWDRQIKVLIMTVSSLDTSRIQEQNPERTAALLFQLNEEYESWKISYPDAQSAIESIQSLLNSSLEGTIMGERISALMTSMSSLEAQDIMPGALVV